MKKLISEFYNTLDDNIRAAWSEDDTSDHLKALIEGLQLLCEKVIHVGEKASKRVEKEVSRDDKVSMTFIHYKWLHEAKAHLILWRDIIFQFQKALILQSEGILKDSDIDTLKTQSRETILEASTYLRHFYESALPELLKTEESKDAYLEDQSLIENPWNIYKTQVQTIEGQSHSLFVQYEMVFKTKNDLDKVSSEVNKVMTLITEELIRIKRLGVDIEKMIGEVKQNAYQKIIAHVDSVEEQALAFNYLNTYNYSVNQVTSQMVEEMNVPMKLEFSCIQYKEINFAVSTKTWLNSEIQPIIMDAQEVLDSVGNSMRLALINVRNRATILSGSTEEPIREVTDLSDFSQPVRVVIETINEKLEDIQEYSKVVTERTSEKLTIRRIYREDRNFLDSSQQYMISQLKLDQSAWIQKLKAWIMERAGFAKLVMANVAEEESLSDSEKIVRYIQTRKTFENNVQYTNIFSTQGYIGESFWVERNKELAHIGQLLNNWREGFRGSVILSGQRFCGKTVFGELIAHRYFPQQTIRLRPNSTIKIEGRSLKIEDELGKALEFIKKHSFNHNHLVWIDDLELWQSIKTPASKNVQTLLRHIDTSSAQLFFIVSMSNWYRHHYSRMFQIEKVFQAEINLDYMPEVDVKRAIMIRHGATHKLLVDNEGQKVISQDFTKMVHKVYLFSGSNIGQALNLWAYFTKPINEDRVMHEPNFSHLLPEFLNDESSILLRAILMNKRTNEYRLRKTLGRAFTEKYNSIVLRLINLGVLIRHMDGFLEINGSVVNEIAAQLHDTGYIKYKHK